MQVEYVQHWGDDLIVCNAARVSFDKKSDWEIVGYDEEYDDDDRVVFSFPLRKLSAKDEKLIHYLADNQHTSCFEHMGATMRLRVPIPVARQIQRHRTFSYNEVSRRYVDSPPEFCWPDEWRKRSPDKKQGSSDEIISEVVFEGSPVPVDEVATAMGELALSLYDALISGGVCPEQARLFLPQSMYTEFYMTGNLRAWVHFLKLRLDEHTQYETRQLAATIKDILMPLFPVSMEALMKE